MNNLHRNESTYFLLHFYFISNSEDETDHLNLSLRLYKHQFDMIIIITLSFVVIDKITSLSILGDWFCMHYEQHHIKSLMFIKMC